MMFTIKRLPEFDAWLEGLRDCTTSIRLAVRLDKAQRGAVLIVMLGGATSPARHAILQQLKNSLRTSTSRTF